MNVDPQDAQRLLREDWSDPTMLAQELVALFRSTSDGPAPKPGDGPGPIAARVREAQAPAIAARAKRQRDSDDGDSQAAARAINPTPPKPQPGQDGQDGKDGFRVDNADLSRSLSALLPRAAYVAPSDPPPIAKPIPFSPPPVSFSDPLQFGVTKLRGMENFDAPIIDAFNPTDSLPQPTSYLGIIVSGKGSTWRIRVIGGGKNSVVDVNIPFIAEDEEAPIGLTVMPVMRVGGQYYYQPAVWLASNPENTGAST